MKEYANTPSKKWPLEPEFLGGCEKVDDNEQNIHPHIDCQMDVKSLSLYSFLGFLVSLLVFHLCLLSSLKDMMQKGPNG